MDGFGWFMSMVLRQLLCIYIDTCYIYIICVVAFTGRVIEINLHSYTTHHSCHPCTLYMHDATTAPKFKFWLLLLFLFNHCAGVTSLKNGT